MSVYIGGVNRRDGERGTFFYFTPMGVLVQDRVSLLTPEELAELFAPSDRPNLHLTCQPDNIPAVYDQFLTHLVAMDFERKDSWYKEERRRYVIRQRDVLQMEAAGQIQILPFAPGAMEELLAEQDELNQTAETLRQQNEELTRRNEELSRSTEALQQQSEELTRRNRELSRSAETLQRQSKEWTRKNEELTRQNHTLLETKSEIEEENNKWYDLQERLEHQTDDLRAEVDRLKDERDQLQTECEESEDRIETLQEEVQALEEEKTALEKEKAALEAQRTALEAYFQEIQSRPLEILGKLEANAQLSDWFQQALTKRPEASKPLPSGLPYPSGTENLPAELCRRVQEFRPGYSALDILNIAVCLTQGFLTVFFGSPGCGKTSICNIFAEVLGLRASGGDSRYLPVSVERGWMSKRDLIGYFNPLTRTVDSSNRQVYDAFKRLHAEPGPILREDGGSAPQPFVILLDEANLSAMEYYWADFMNLCEDSLTEGALVQPDGTRRKIRGTVNLGEEPLEVPDWLRFLATINTDHTTETLSPRLLDRAWLVSLPSDSFDGRPPEAKSKPLRVSWPEMQDAFGGTEEAWPEEIEAVFSELTAWLQEQCRVPVSHRVRLAVRRYWSGAQRAFGAVWSPDSADGQTPEIAALDYAVSQRVLPQILGSGEDFAKKLEEFEKKCRSSRLNRSARIVEDIRLRGADTEYFQFF